jgi:hypothetical protein
MAPGSYDLESSWGIENVYQALVFALETEAMADSRRANSLLRVSRGYQLVLND